MICSIASPCSGGATGSCAFKSPGSICANTGKSSTCSRYSATQSTSSWPKRRKSSLLMSPNVGASSGLGSVMGRSLDYGKGKGKGERGKRVKGEEGKGEEGKREREANREQASPLALFPFYPLPLFPSSPLPFLFPLP